jgi:hypothetical protein
MPCRHVCFRVKIQAAYYNVYIYILHLISTHQDSQNIHSPNKEQAHKFTDTLRNYNKRQLK